VPHKPFIGRECEGREGALAVAVLMSTLCKSNLQVSRFQSFKAF